MKMLLGEAWVDRPKRVEVRDPWDGSVVDTVPQATPADLDAALESATRGAKAARAMTVYDRATVLRDTANRIEARSEDFAKLIAREGAKTIREARKEVSRAVNTLNVSADQSKRVVGETIPFDSFPGGENRRGWFERVPVGVIAAITPFNDPLNLVAHKVGPAIGSGNAVVLKPATATPLSALELCRAFVDSGLPAGVLQCVTGEAREMGDTLITDERVRMVSFTGGVDTGRHIARTAGIKKLGLELGSNSPVVVWADADVDHAVEQCVSGAFWAAGQNCIGVQRLYVHDRVYDRFRDAFVAKASKYRLGPKLDEKTDMGTLIDEKNAKRVESWVREAASAGARVLTGGERDGCSMRPTVLERVPLDAKVHREEVFGPTVNLYRVSDFDDTVAQVNSLPFGINAAIFTRDLDIAFRAVDRFEAGTVIVNDSTDYRLDAMPFGGVKNSGLGREGIRFAMEEMTEPKVVCFTFPKS
jgi:glyceraldehyde-3-phosphate dehydrogenase (NADP+)